MSLLIPSARELGNLLLNPAYNCVPLRLATAKAIFEAADSVAAGATSGTTAAITKSNTTEAVQALFNELAQAGYTVNNGTTTFTVTWGQ